jgi:hypothetical protein
MRLPVVTIAARLIKDRLHKLGLKVAGVGLQTYKQIISGLRLLAGLHGLLQRGRLGGRHAGRVRECVHGLITCHCRTSIINHYRGMEITGRPRAAQGKFELAARGLCGYGVASVAFVLP